MGALTCQLCGAQVTRLMRVTRMTFVGGRIVERRAWVCPACAGRVRAALARE